jgi:hypothetical protein
MLYRAASHKKIRRLTCLQAGRQLPRKAAHRALDVAFRFP